MCKDVKLKQNESKVESKIRFKEIKNFKNTEESYKLYFQSRIYELYNTPLNSRHTKWIYTDAELVKHLLPSVLDSWIFNELDFDEVTSYRTYVPKIISKYNL